MLIGDGTSDLLAGEGVDLFVGYGGVVARPRVEAGAPVFVRSPGLAPILPLAAGPAAYTRLEETSYRALFWEGVRQVREHTTFADGSLGTVFGAACEAAGL